MPEKNIFRPNASRAEILSYHEEQGNLPRPFAPFQFALNASGSSDTLVAPPTAKTRGSSVDIPKDYRLSTQSFSASAARLPSLNRSSFLSSFRDSFTPGRRVSARTLSISSALTTTTSASGGSANPAKGLQMQTVRQLFTPILPDEPTIMLNERVGIMQSFDDGWCIVARDNPFGANGEVELGAVPAWCFVKPMKGLKSERPVRSSSLGVTVKMDWEAAPDKPRGEYISWSNF